MAASPEFVEVLRRLYSTQSALICRVATIAELRAQVFLLQTDRVEAAGREVELQRRVTNMKDHLDKLNHTAEIALNVANAHSKRELKYRLNALRARFGLPKMKGVL